MKKYDSYKDSGIEWIGEIPSHWSVKRGKEVLKFSNGYPFNSGLFSMDENEGFPLVRIRDLKSDKITTFYKGEIVRDALINDNDFIIGMDGDFNIVKWNKGKALLNQRLCKIEGVNHLETNYLSYSLPFYLKIINDLTYYTTVKHLSNNDLFEQKFLVPNSQEQTTITNYLDHKTTQIDKLISKKEQLIQLLEEERVAVINQAVTKGLDPSVPMKDSGIEWLGEIPEHWECKRIGHVSKVIRGASPRPAGDPLLFSGDFLPWITVKEVTNAVGKFITGTESFLTELGSKQTRILEPETLILSNSGATLGVPRITLIQGGINDGSVAFLSLEVERDYLYYFFVTHTNIYREEAAGYGQPNLNTDIVKSTKIPVPPINEQIKIVSQIEVEINRFNKLLKVSANEIELLKEYKTALISDVVTGKVDVRN
jgi:type I restriction enzyme S subunit